MEDDGTSNQPKWVSYVAIAIWLLIAMIVSIAIMASNPNRSKALELIVQVITAISGMAAAIAAFLAVRAANETLNQVRADRRAELELKRPVFVLQQGWVSIWQTETEKDIQTYIGATFLNKGSNTASDVVTKTFILNEELGIEDVINQATANDVVSSTSFILAAFGVKITNYSAFHYANIWITFIDKITSKEYVQDFYYGWIPGPYRTQHIFEPISREEMLEIRDAVKLYEKDAASHNA
jgi:hypothetical protein